ncbi:electron transfer flavoprotein subunit beta/FixA family protein [Candidatus Zinderia endosymbiont of Aphrophora alni]|uniref:electron transfer flavoprotein subunit beta/FixA family protein n=1 Tax=Candidatus Zinderia endosymbiont of Aphrophora alni TaxID=3077951 RepID=UPI0030CACC8D
MKVLIAIKEIIDHNLKITIKDDNKNLKIKNLKKTINPFDEIALEEAIRLKEKGKIKETISISCGNISSKEILQKSLAMGIDKSILIENTTKTILQPIDIAKLIKKIIKKDKKIKLVILGKQSIDYDYNQTGQMLAGLLNWPQAISITKLKIKNNQIYVTKEIDSGIEKLLLNLPAIITVDLRLNEPRYITLIKILKAKKKKINILNTNKFNINLNKNIKILNFSYNKTKKKKIKIINSIELLKIIKNYI